MCEIPSVGDLVVYGGITAEVVDVYIATPDGAREPVDEDGFYQCETWGRIALRIDGRDLTVGWNRYIERVCQ